ncbi:MAG TPA: serine/threonine-protein kinase [Polyangia bacterium]|nr:serine/threonine-protein kinase [Polyangia bacterium]
MTEPHDTGETGIQEGASPTGRVGLVGKTLGRYRISAELGRGGMATVYRAFDPQLARDVAVKVMHGAFTGRGDIERRFRREAQAVAALKHECVVDVFDFAPGGDGEPAYIVSELVEGPTLRQLLERAGGRIVPEVAVLIAARVAAALGAAHTRGIVHRDVKPDNVMIDLGARKGARARVLLTDFGIARMTEDDTMTATGSILGSPSYMSPEQAKSGAIVPASDVFSLGATLYQMVVGRAPFQGKDPLTVIAALISGEFLRPAQVEARVGPELEAVILRCLKRQPAERFVDGNAVAAALRELAVASAGAVGDEASALRALHEDHVAFERRIGPAVADASVEQARACVRRRELSRALAHINRALAYAAGHRGAEAVLATISSRRRWARVAAVLATLCLAGGAVAGLRALGRHASPPLPAASVTPPVPDRAPAAPPREPAPPPAPAPAAAAPSEPASAPARKRDARRHAGAGLAPGPTPSAVVPTEQPAPAAEPASLPPTAAAAPAVVPPAALAPARAAPVPVAGITLRARQGFCSPSLDDRPPALRPIYEGVAVGLHDVYCTPPGGARVLVGTYELRAGTHPDLIILPGADGRPTLGRPQ